MTPGRIFVQIASYRDPELVPTVKNCLDNALDPDSIRIGVCWQYDDTEPKDIFDTDPRIRVYKIPCSQSLGVCWARNRVQTLYEDEEFVLQIDSHHRFARGWDRALKQALVETGSTKPLLTGYLPGYDPMDNSLSQAGAAIVGIREFPPNGIPYFKRYPADFANQSTAPFPARFCSGHFIFTTGMFNREIVYDPECYFIGEEISITVRAFTHGFDLFHPAQNVIWHAYGGTRKRHWDDHDTRTGSSYWEKLVKKSNARVRALLGLENPEKIDLKEFGLGNERSLSDYQQYAGLHFALKAVHPAVLENRPPPTNPYYETREEWLSNSQQQFTKRIDIPESLRQLHRDQTLRASFYDSTGKTIDDQIVPRQFVDDALSLPNPALMLYYRSFHPASSWKLDRVDHSIRTECNRRMQY